MVQEKASSSPVSIPMLVWVSSMLEIPLNKELIADCLAETPTKLRDLILPVKVLMSADLRVQHPN